MGRDAARLAVLRRQRGRQRLRPADAHVHLEAERQPQLRLSRLEGGKEYFMARVIFYFTLVDIIWKILIFGRYQRKDHKKSKVKFGTISDWDWDYCTHKTSILLS